MAKTKFEAWQAAKEMMKSPAGIFVRGLDKPVVCGQCPMRWMVANITNPDHYYRKRFLDVCGARPDLKTPEKTIDNPNGPVPDFCPIEEYDPCSRIDGYDLQKLMLFAEMCKANDVQEHDLKQAAWNLEFAVRAWENEREEIVKNIMDEITMRFTPDFKKAAEEMFAKEENDDTTEDIP